MNPGENTVIESLLVTGSCLGTIISERKYFPFVSVSNGERPCDDVLRNPVFQCWLLGLYPALAVERSNLVSDAGLDYVGSLVWLFNVVV